jgi:hypothetical protein
MTRTKFAQPVLDAEQQAEAERIYQRIRGAFDDEAKRIAQLMASKETRDLFGQTEYQLRDRVHALGAEALEAAADERIKKGGLPRS